MSKRFVGALLIVLALSAVVRAGVGDVQTKTDHPWYPGELSCSTWERLFATQAEQYTRVTGRKVAGDEDKALASWFYRNTHYHHCTDGGQDLFDKGWSDGEKLTRDYWTGLFANGYGLCFDTHHQYAGEINTLLGPNRSRAAGVKGHTTFEVWLTGGPYGEGRWALLDHDVSTVVFTPDGSRLMGLMEINKDAASVKNSAASRGWLPGGLHPSDPGAYQQVNWVGYDTGYAAVPPMVHLRAGETLRRYVAPGLEDGKRNVPPGTFAYWGINYNTAGIPGPERSRTWVNQPEKMYQARSDAGHKPGQARYGNAVYTYKPDFAGGKYKEGVIDESDSQVTFEFYTPYIIAATPSAAAAKEEWGIYKDGCTGGLMLTGKIDCSVELSTDQGKTWKKFDGKDGLDLTDAAKGHRQYFLRLGAGAKALAASGLTIRTVCQCSSSVVPRVKEGANAVTYQAGGKAVISAGPNMDQAAAHVVEGAVNSPTVTLELSAPRGAKATAVYAAARVACGAPPKASKYAIDVSTDGGKTWKPILKDHEVVQHPPEPGDWWSQTFNMADGELPGVAGPVRARFTNTGKRPYLRAEMHLVYTVANTSPVKVTYAWSEAGQARTAEHTYAASPPGKPDASWTFDAGKDPQTLWVEYAAE